MNLSASMENQAAPATHFFSMSEPEEDDSRSNAFLPGATAPPSSSLHPCCSSFTSDSYSCRSLTQMNPDSLISILQLLPVHSIVSFSMTCTKFRSLASSDALWEFVCRRDWGTAPITALFASPSSPSSSSSSSPPAVTDIMMIDKRVKKKKQKKKTGIMPVPWKWLYQRISHVGSVSCSRLTSKDAVFPQPRASHSLNYVSDYLVLFGGGREGGRHLDDMWVSYIGNGAWRGIWQSLKLGSPSPSGRFGHTCTLVGDILVLFGGISDNGIRLNDTWFGRVILDHDSGSSISWENSLINASGVTAPPPRGAHACCSIGDDKMLIHGGIGLDGVRLDDMWLLDLSGGLASVTWQPITATLSQPPARSGHTLTWINNYASTDTCSNLIVVLFGGRGVGYEVLNDVWILLGMNEEDGWNYQWLQVIYSCPTLPGQELPLPRVGHSATSILGGRLLIYGGEDSLRHRKDDFWLLDINPVVPQIHTRVVTIDSKNLLCKMWKRLKTKGQKPDCRSFHTACADRSQRRIYIFGGMIDGILQPAEAYGLSFDGNLYLVEIVIL